MYKGVIRSRSAEKPQMLEFGSSRLTTAASGHFQSRSQTKSSRITHDKACKSVSSIDGRSFSLEFGRSSSKKVSGRPIQTLINEELSKEMESRRHSPSLVAKLMGLDTLPPPPQAAHKHRKNAGSGFQAASSAGCQGNCAQTNEHSYQKSNDEDQEFKDIFEVMETGKFKKHKSQSTWKAMQRSKKSETDMNFIRKKFMDAERLSTDETLQNSKELDDALEILHCNKDLFLEILQDRSSLLAKHLQDVNHAPVSSHSSQITVLRSSKVDKRRNTEWIKPERKCEGRSHIHKEVTRSSRKPAPGIINLAPKESISGVTQNSSTAPPYVGKSGTHVHPTRIVVLKPSIEKTQKMIGPVSFSHDNLNFGSRKQRESVASAIRELYKEGIDTHRFSENVGHSKHKSKGSREIAGEIARQIRHTVGGHSKNVITSDLKAYGGKENSYSLSDVSILKNPESYSPSPYHFDESANDFSPSSSFSTDSTVNREARKRMSERWKMTRQFHDVGVSANGVMNTLGEMLALSDREIPNTEVVPSGKKKVSYDKFMGNALLGTWDFPLCSQSKNSWEDGSSRKLRRSKSLPAASTAYGSPKGSCRKQGVGNCYMLKDVLNMSPDDFSDGYYTKPHKSLVRSSGHFTSESHQLQYAGEENLLPEHEIHVHSEELRKSVHVRILSEENLLHDAFHDEVVAARLHLTDTPLFPLCENETSSLTAVEENTKQFVMQFTSENDNLYGHNENINSKKEDLNHHPQVDPPPEEGHVLSSKECEQPSPISVLEPPSEEESSCSGCFGRISADLQELRMQLKLLKLESAEREGDEFGITTSSDEDSAGDCQSILQSGEKLEAFKDDDDRDFSYLLDILIDSGIQGSHEGRSSGACHTLNHQVDPDVFDKLEKKYNVLTSWTRSERKLLFDLVNSILVGVAAPCIDQQLWADGGLVEGLWQMVVKQKKDLDFNLEEKILDPRWVHVDEDIEVITKDMEKMLDEDLLDEILAEFLIG